MGAPQYEQAGADVAGTGTTDTIPRWTGPSTLGDSGLIDNGTAIYTSTRRVGVDTSTTLANVKLQVGSASALTNYQGAPAGFIIPTGNGTWMEFAENSTNGTTFRISKDSTTGVLFNANGRDIGFVASGYQTFVSSSQMVIKTTGYVGIGTASPGARLHAVAADGTYQFAVSGTTKGIRFLTTASVAQIDAVDQTLSASYQPLFINGSTVTLANSGSPALTVNTSGNVGIGVTPISPLHVKGNATNTDGILTLTPNTAGRSHQVQSLQASSLFRIFDQSAGASRLEIDINGNISAATTGGTFNASTTNAGIKLPATPGNADTQTLDAYQEIGTGTPAEIALTLT
jgi:hypothetical protein